MMVTVDFPAKLLEITRTRLILRECAFLRHNLQRCNVKQLDMLPLP